MKSILKASRYINHNRITNGTYSRTQKLRLILGGMWEVWKVTNYVRPASVVECNLCGWKGSSYVNFYTGYNHVCKKAICPSCFSHPRHRSYFYCLRHVFKDLKNKVKVLHFSPEHQIENIIKGYDLIDYLSVDIDPSKAMQKEDIQNLSFPDDYFDVVVCIHVLEHIDNDRAAMSEIYRILKPGGVALLDVPIDYSLSETFEDPTIISPEQRTKAYWQWDHVRLYGRDYPDKLRSCGFNVQEISMVETESLNIKRLGLEDKPNYICAKQ